MVSRFCKMIRFIVRIVDWERSVSPDHCVCVSLPLAAADGDELCRLVLAASSFDHVSPLLRRVHWLKASGRIEFKFAVVVYKCLHGTAALHLSDELHWSAADSQARHAASSLW